LLIERSLILRFGFTRALREEGREMQHCVGKYDERCVLNRINFVAVQFFDVVFCRGDTAAAGLYCIEYFAQNDETCVVFGIPREAIAVGAVDEIVPIQEVAQRVLFKLSQGGARNIRF